MAIGRLAQTLIELPRGRAAGETDGKTAILRCRQFEDQTATRRDKASGSLRISNFPSETLVIRAPSWPTGSKPRG